MSDILEVSREYEARLSKRVVAEVEENGSGKAKDFLDYKRRAGRIEAAREDFALFRQVLKDFYGDMGD